MPVVFVPKRHREGETRVAATPESVAKLVKLGLSVVVEPGAGGASNFLDEQYASAGAAIGEGPEDWRTADVVLVPDPLGPHPDLGVLEAEALKEGAVVMGLLDPLGQTDTMGILQRRGITALALELLPRISRAQSMDALSSQANIGGYKAALIAAEKLDRYMPLLMTAAGTVKPSRVVIMGAGVAGLQALATCRRLGAVVEVSDIRPEVKEQVESLGGRFIDLPDMQADSEGGYAKAVTPEFLKKQQAIVAERVKQADAVITTAQVPGRKAPLLVTEEMVASMRPGAVIVDMAVGSGGNCALSKAGETVVAHGVSIIGEANLPATMPRDASTLYASNLVHVLTHITDDGAIDFDVEDEILMGLMGTYKGKVVNKRLADAMSRAGGAA